MKRGVEMKTRPTKSHGGMGKMRGPGVRLVKRKIKVRNSLMRASSKAACSLPPMLQGNQRTCSVKQHKNPRRPDPPPHTSRVR
jgi:hypothetical protein